MILKFNNFHINESHTKDYDVFESIFIDLIHLDFKLKVDKVFYSSIDSGYSEHADQSHKLPGYLIQLDKISNKFSITDYSEFKTIDLGLVKDIVDILEECGDRISDYGVNSLKEFRFSDSFFRIEYRLLDSESKEEEVNTSDGFDSFIGLINKKWLQAHNKLTRSFNFERTKEGLILSPIDNTISTKSFFSIAKSFVNGCIRRNYYIGGGPNWKYKYEITQADNKIIIKFIDRTDETPVGQRRYDNENNW